jgi:hypothetical protein
MSNEKSTNKEILIVGGGTAGWMTAALFARRWAGRGFKIKLVESEAIGIIGVGEGSTPKMRRFFESLGVKEEEWMPQCNATYKCGIRFPNWATRKGYGSYYHPFFSEADNEAVRAFYQNATIRSKNLDVHGHPDAFFISNYLADSKKAPTPNKTTQYTTDYAYDFDASLIGYFICKYATNREVEHIYDTVESVQQKEDGSISSIKTEKHGEMKADFFVDCTGFASLLIGKTLGVPFQSYDNILFNDRAIAVPTPLNEDGSIPSQTMSTGMRNGWAWKIPLTNRFGNGYVYSSSFVEDDDAETELRTYLGLLEKDVECRRLKMRVGRTDACWSHNCLAVGLSQGFIEPLEATALMIVQDTVETFMQRYEQGGFTERYRTDVNDKINAIFDGVKNYVFMHYKLNTRDDTDYWRANRANETMSEDVSRILSIWDRGGDLLTELKDQASRLVYSPTSWYCILAGMGRFPRKPKKPKRNLQVFDPKEAEAFCKSMLQHFPDHKEKLATMAN